ncbi:MAG: glutamate 5-kinase [Bacteroidales bacterium]|nr:glutamate 5-kinase [Bacteroidales bacterium]MDT8430337.1 glutamate 5-kinase [Bacteroidales bacterium]
MNHRVILKDKHRIIVKVGTALITQEDGRINLLRIEKMARVISNLISAGKEVILVTSGAVGAGMGIMKLEKKPTGIVEKQALASIGQAALLRMYETFFNEYDQVIGQVLLTRDGIENETRRTNARNTINRLLEMNVIPVINENDAVSTEEIEFGDNDMLAARVAELINADLLIILTNTDGVYTSNPHKNSDAKQVSTVMEAKKDLKGIVAEGTSDVGSGGMQSKIRAAEICRKNNIDVVIAEGSDADVLFDILAGKKQGTHFVSKSTGIKSAL